MTSNPSNSPNHLHCNISCVCRLVSCLLAFASIVVGAAELSLDGEGWYLAMDPLRHGESLGWHAPPEGWDMESAVVVQGWDQVSVPHCWTVDARFGEYTGVMWYCRSFVPPRPLGGKTVWRLTFDAIGERCRVWVNGRDLGAHESVGVPIVIDATGVIEPGRQNYIAIAVDNGWDMSSIPGARTGRSAGDQLYPWLNYGGLLDSIRIESLPAAHVALQKLEAVPLGDDKARLDVTLWPGPGGFGRGSGIVVEIMDPSAPGNPVASATISPPAPDAESVSVTLMLPGVGKWSLAERRLYESRVTLRSADGVSHTHSDTFGIRDVRVDKARFLLNGEAVYLAGANRARGHPTLGGISTYESVAADLQLMKDAGLVFARLQHHPVNRHVLDWADRNGMLVIVEYPIWDLKAADLENPVRRKRYEEGMAALMRNVWNHPSVVGWCVGNEYESWLPEGVAWTRDMVAFVKRLDSTRPVTFAALFTELSVLKEKRNPAAHGMNYVDFLCANVYFKPEEIPEYLDPVHEFWPEKPLLITEFGLRADRVQDERERIDYFDKVFALVRARPWICNFSFWTFNDYASRFPGTGLDGYRRWGLVDEHRKPRPLYEHVARELRASGWENPAAR